MSTLRRLASRFDFREAHYWLAGYSAAVAGRPAVPEPREFADDYRRGYEAGRRLLHGGYAL